MIKKDDASFYRLTLGFNAANKSKQNKTKLINPTTPQISIHNIYTINSHFKCNL